MSSCPVCDNTFDTRAGMKSHCGMMHSDGENPFRLECICNNCGDRFYKIISKVQRGEGKYCSKECHNVGQNVRDVTKCLNCGCEISDIPYEIERGRTYCSKNCQGEYESNKISKECNKCGKGFEVTKYRHNNGRGKYCSYDCLEKDKFYNDNNLRKTKEYKNWRSKVLERDNYTCQDCGYGSNLECHHIVPIYESKEMSTDVDNGITLCNSCHANRHRNLEDGVAHLISGRVK